MYKVIYLFGLFVRQLLLPNPFAPIGAEGEFINWCASAFFVPLSFAQVSLIYRRGSNPAAGSIYFNIMYFVNTGVTYLIMLIYPIQWLMLFAIGVYLVGSFVLLDRIGNRVF